jgi:hypothetical protein
MNTRTAEVSAFMDKFDHPLKPEAQAVRDIIKGVNQSFTPVNHLFHYPPSFCTAGKTQSTV